MAQLNTAIMGSCGLGMMSGFGYYHPTHVPDDKGHKPASGHFIASFRCDQKAAFDSVCEKHTPVFTHLINGAHGNYKIAFVLFKWGKS